MKFVPLSQRAINEFKEIYRKDYGIELDDGEARELATRCLKMMHVVYKHAAKRRR